MCGRAQLTHSADEIAAFFDLPPAQIEFRGPRYNVAPGARLPAVRLDAAAQPQGAMLRWGLVPAWAKDEKIGYRMINARSETAAEKPSFRQAWQRRRCAVAVSGYYEWWRRKPKARPPERAFHFRPIDEPMFALAGLWERWASPGGDVLETCTLLTTDAAEPLRAVHDRMPVMLSRETLAAWVSDGPAPPLARIAPPDRTGVRVAIEEVSTHVNDARNEDSRCLTAVSGMSLSEKLMQLRGWCAGFDATPDGPAGRWVDPESNRPGRLDAADAALARRLLTEMDAADVDTTGLGSLPPIDVAEAWITWQS